MAQVTGPTVPRWRLGEELGRLRNAAGVAVEAVAEQLECSVSKVRKIESGERAASRAELMVLLDLYGVAADAELRSQLYDLQRLGRQRGWWLQQYGTLPARFAQFLSLEGSATTIRIFEPTMVTGLLQAPDYARAVAAGSMGIIAAAEIDRQVEIKLARQQHILGANQPELWVVLDEAVLRRVVGGPAVMRAQLQHLASLGDQVTLQVVPYAAGAYPGFSGAFTIFEFPDDLHSPVVYVEGHAGNTFMEKKVQVEQSNRWYNRIAASALSRDESAKFIADVIDEMDGRT